MAEELTPMELETVAALLRHKRRADAAKDLGIKVRGLSRRCIAHPAIVREVLRLRRAELDKVTAERTGPSLKDEAVRLLREVTESDLAIVKVISDQSAGKREFYARLRTHFRGDPLQLGLSA